MIMFFTGSSQSAIKKSEASQTSSHLTQCTPRKKHLQRKLANQRKQLVRLKKKENECSEKKAMSTLRKLLPKQIVDFVEMQLKLHKRKGKARRYSPEIK